jgi:hypothetical protein
MKKLSSVSLFCSAIIFLTQYGDLNEVWAAAAVTWQEEWSKTVQAAEKEGQVVLYANEGLEGSVSDFQKKFPKIKVVVVAGRSGQLVTRLMAERRAGKYLADVAKLGTGSAAALYRARPFPLQEIDGALFLPEVMDRSKWWGNNRQYADPEGKYLLSPCVSVHIDLVSYNTELLKPADVTSYWDILNPKWERQNRVYGSTSGRRQRRRQTRLFSSRARAAIFQAALVRRGSCTQPGAAAGGGLAGARQVGDSAFYLAARSVAGQSAKASRGYFGPAAHEGSARG